MIEKKEQPVREHIAPKEEDVLGVLKKHSPNNKEEEEPVKTEEAPEKENKPITNPFNKEEEDNSNDAPLEAQAGREEENQTGFSPGLPRSPIEGKIGNGEAANRLEEWANEIREAS